VFSGLWHGRDIEQTMDICEPCRTHRCLKQTMVAPAMIGAQ
jgi:hypothetical protein